MAERKSGPVKPPILDLTARPPERAAAKPTEASDATDPARPDPGMTKAPSVAGGPAETRTSRTPAPKPRGTFSPVARLVGVGLFGALAGGAIGLAGAWGLATLGLWPERPVSGADSSLADEMTALYVRKSDLGGILDRTLGPVTSELADVKAELAGVEARLRPIRPANWRALALASTGSNPVLPTSRNGAMPPWPRAMPVRPRLLRRSMATCPRLRRASPRSRHNRRRRRRTFPASKPASPPPGPKSTNSTRLWPRSTRRRRRHRST